MKPLAPFVLLAFIALPACRSTPAEAPPPEVADLRVVAPALPTEKRPILKVDVGADPVSDNVRRIQIDFAGLGIHGPGERPGPQQLAAMITDALLRTRHFHVVQGDYEAIKRRRANEAAGVIDPTSKRKAVAARYSVDCTVLKCAVENSRGGGWGVGPFRTRTRTSKAVVRLAVRVTDLETGLVLTSATVSGEQSSSQRRTRWRVPLFSKETSSSAQPVLQAATEKAIFELIKHLADEIPVA